jgi:hypothetical protein
VKTMALAILLTFAGAAAAGAAVDPGTGHPETTAPSGKPAAAAAVTQVYTLGYTTAAVVPHYHALDHPSLATAQAEILALGHTLVPVNGLTAGDLAGLDGLIVGVVNAYTTLTSTQIDAIEAFVRGGGNLYFLGENNWAFHDNNVAVGTRFGIVYPAQYGDPTDVVLTLVSGHPIIQGPLGPVATIDGSNNSAGAYGSMTDPGPYGESIVNFPNGYSGCVVIEPGALNPGSGFVVALAEINTFDNGQIDLADNLEFWHNIFAYAPGAVATAPAAWGEVKSLFR